MGKKLWAVCMVAVLLMSAACSDDSPNGASGDRDTAVDTTQKDTGGEDTAAGVDTQVEDTAGVDTTGTDTAGVDTVEADTASADTTGADTTGADTAGMDTTGADAADMVEPPGEVLAFPGAQGFGARVTGGRGGAVIKVTNLNSGGEGSLSWAVEQPGARTVVFEVSGVISGDVRIPHGDLTIAGQTAPCAGITLNGTLYTPYGEATSNIIVRHLRISPPSPEPAACASHDAIQFSTANRIMLDHIDASHAGDEIIDFWGGAHDITVQWSSIVFPIAGGEGACSHPKGLINHRACIDGDDCSGDDPLGGRISVHHNLFAHCENRTPALSTGPADVVNNVVYNGREGFVHHNVVGAHSTETDAVGDFNIIGNYYIEGPSSSLAPLWLDPENSGGPIPTRYHIFDNWVEDDDFSGRFDDPYTTPGFGDAYTFACCGVVSSQVEAAPFDFSADPAYIPVDRHAPAAAYQQVIAEAGAWPRDIITRTAVQEVEARSGSRRDFVPADFMEGLTACAAPVDSDGDGMADDWETAQGLNPAADDHNEVMPSGYTAIEAYINGLAEGLVGG